MVPHDEENAALTKDSRNHLVSDSSKALSSNRTLPIVSGNRLK